MINKVEPASYAGETFADSSRVVSVLSLEGPGGSSELGLTWELALKRKAKEAFFAGCNLYFFWLTKEGEV